MLKRERHDHESLLRLRYSFRWRQERDLRSDRPPSVFVNGRPPILEEPEALGEQAQARFTEISRDTERMRLLQHWAKGRATIEAAIVSLREAGINDRELWVIERRLMKLDEKLKRQ